MGRTIKAKIPIEYMVEQALVDTEIANEIVGSIRAQNKYYEEKLALKMLDFFEEEEKVVNLYAEAKTNYPLLAELMENKRPYLKELLAEAKKLYEKNTLGN